MMHISILKEGDRPSPELLEQVRLAAQREPQPDEDCPELTPEMFKICLCAARQRNRALRNQHEFEEKAKKTEDIETIKKSSGSVSFMKLD